MPSTYSGPRLPSELFSRIGYTPRNPKRRDGAARVHADRSDGRKSEKHQQDSQKAVHKQTESSRQTLVQRKAQSSALIQLGFKSSRRSLHRTLSDDLGPEKPTSSKSAPPGLGSKYHSELDREEKEIAALEGKLGIKSQRLPKSFEDDGLGDLLRGLEDDEAVHQKRKRDEDRAWIANKRAAPAVEGYSSRSDGELSSDDTSGFLSEDETWPTNDNQVPDPFNRQSSESVSIGDRNNEHQLSTNKADTKRTTTSHSIFDKNGNKIQPIRENPYVAPVSSMESGEAKYLPPSRRPALSQDNETSAMLKRRIHGLLNRLSDSNIISIVVEIEKLYQSHPRQYVTEALTNLLVNLLSDVAPLTDNYVLTHAGLVSALYKAVGADFGAYVVEHYVWAIDGQQDIIQQTSVDDQAGNAASKRMKNLLSMICQLYNFEVLSAALLFDYIRLFLLDFNEFNTELLWIIVRLSGMQLRTDDPSSLKDIVTLLQKCVEKSGSGNLSVRTSFIVDNIVDLKNNRLKSGLPGRAVTAEHAQQMKKTLRVLSERSTSRATEPLRVSLFDIRNSDKKGKWWLVGASWKGNVPSSNKSEDAPTFTGAKHQPLTRDKPNPDETISLEELAKSSGMNTTVRRAIFTTLLSANDYKEAFERILRLPLRSSQQQEIPRVLLHCARAETSYNPFYTLISKQLCLAAASSVPTIDGESHSGQRSARLQKAFQYALWDAFAQVEDGEHEDSGFDHSQQMPLSAIVNQAKMVGELIADRALPITTLKRFDMLGRESRSRTFLEVLLLTLLKRLRKKKAEESLSVIITQARASPDLTSGLRYFLDKFVKRSDLIETEMEKKHIERQCRQIVERLSGTDNDD